jgi:hypothetical protein
MNPMQQQSYLRGAAPRRHISTGSICTLKRDTLIIGWF